MSPRIPIPYVSIGNSFGLFGNIRAKVAGTVEGKASNCPEAQDSLSFCITGAIYFGLELGARAGSVGVSAGIEGGGTAKICFKLGADDNTLYANSKLCAVARWRVDVKLWLINYTRGGELAKGCAQSGDYALMTL